MGAAAEGGKKCKHSEGEGERVVQTINQPHAPGWVEKRSVWAIDLKIMEGWGDGRFHEKESCHGNQKLNCS